MPGISKPQRESQCVAIKRNRPIEIAHENVDVAYSYFHRTLLGTCVFVLLSARGQARAMKPASKRKTPAHGVPRLALMLLGGENPRRSYLILDSL